MMDSNGPANFLEETIKNLGYQEEYLREQLNAPVVETGSVHEVNVPALRSRSRSTGRMAGRILHEPPVVVDKVLVTEKPKAPRDLSEVTMSCKDEDPELFFPLGETRPADVEKIRRAKEICLGCEAVEACGAQALEKKEESGIWGGMTPSERRKILRERQKAARS